MNDERNDILEEALHHLAEAADLLMQADLGEYFRRTAMPELEGTDAGWMGTNFLVDQVKAALTQQVCDVCGEAGADAEMYDADLEKVPEVAYVVHTDCGLGLGWEVA